MAVPGRFLPRCGCSRRSQRLVSITTDLRRQDAGIELRCVRGNRELCSDCVEFAEISDFSDF